MTERLEFRQKLLLPSKYYNITLDILCIFVYYVHFVLNLVSKVNTILTLFQILVLTNVPQSIIHTNYPVISHLRLSLCTIKFKVVYNPQGDTLPASTFQCSFSLRNLTLAQGHLHESRCRCNIIISQGSEFRARICSW